jgi:hypothetical protein
MAQPRSPVPVLQIVGVFSRHADALEWARQRLEAEFGAVGLTSLPYHFHQTTYYTASMGADLRKQFLAFENLVDPDCLPMVKLRTNALEVELAQSGRYAEPRPLNLDPGVLGLGKLLLATTKDQAHRVYLRQGIFAEVTLRFEAGSFEPWPWTYADYRQECVRAFFREAREYYRRRMRETACPLRGSDTIAPVTSAGANPGGLPDADT